MATQTTMDELLRTHNCQTPTCKNVFDVVTWRAGDSNANWHCWACAVAFWSQVIEQTAAIASEQMDAQALADTAAGVADDQAAAAATVPV